MCTHPKYPVALLVLLASLAALDRPLSAQAKASGASLDERTGAWVAVERTEHGTVYLDTAAVLELGRGVYQVRTRWSFAAPHRDGDGERYRSSVAVRAVDCHTRETALLAYADRDGERTVDTRAQPLFGASWDPVRPGTPVERIAESTCALARRAGARLASQGGGG